MNIKGPVIMLVLTGKVNNVKRKITLMGDYHDYIENKKCKNINKAISTKDFLKNTFTTNKDKKYIFYMEVFDGYNVSNFSTNSTIDSYMTELSVFTLSNLENNTFSNVKFVASDIRPHLPYYSYIYNELNFPEDYSRQFINIKDYYKNMCTALYNMCNDKDNNKNIFYNNVLKNDNTQIENINIKSCAKIALSATNTYKELKHNMIDINTINQRWFLQSLILNDSYVINHFLNSKENEYGIAYMGYWHVFNITYRLVHDFGFKVKWISSDIDIKNINNNLTNLNEDNEVDLIDELGNLFSFDIKDQYQCIYNFSENLLH